MGYSEQSFATVKSTIMPVQHRMFLEKPEWGVMKLRKVYFLNRKLQVMQRIFETVCRMCCNVMVQMRLIV